MLTSQCLYLHTLIVYDYLYRFVYGMNVHRAAADSGVHQPWRELHHDVEFSGYSVTAFQHHQQLMALGSLNGCIKVLSVASTGVCQMISLVPRLSARKAWGQGYQMSLTAKLHPK